MNAQEDNLCQAALAYAARGFRVHPLLEGGKRPRLKAWAERASRDPEQIERWWLEWPDANIGITTGQGSGLIVVDIDGPVGEESACNLELPPTAWQETGRAAGGRHLVYAYDGASRNRTDYRPGVDIRGGGGYIVAAPSVHPSGSTYVWHEVPIAPAPAWLVEAVAPERQQGEIALPPSASFPPWVNDLSVRLCDATDLEHDLSVRAADRARYRNRSAVLATAICQAIRFGICDSEIHDVMMRSTLVTRFPDQASRSSRLTNDIARIRRFIEERGDGWLDSMEHRDLVLVHVRGSTFQKVANAHGVLCEQQGLGVYTASVREVALAASCSPATALKYTERLVDAGWLRLVSKGIQGGISASRYRLAIPKGVQNLNTPHHQHPVAGCVQQMNVDPAHDAARRGALGSMYSTVALLHPERPLSVEALADALGRTRGTARRHLQELTHRGVAVKAPGGWVLAPDYLLALDRWAVQTGVAGRGERERKALEWERHRRQVDRTVEARRSEKDLRAAVTQNFDLVAAETAEVLYTVGRALDDEELKGQCGPISNILVTLPGGDLDHLLANGRFEPYIKRVRRPRKSATAAHGREVPPDVPSSHEKEKPDA